MNTCWMIRAPTRLSLEKNLLRRCRRLSHVWGRSKRLCGFPRDFQWKTFSMLLITKAWLKRTPPRNLVARLKNKISILCFTRPAPLANRRESCWRRSPGQMLLSTSSWTMGRLPKKMSYWIPNRWATGLASSYFPVSSMEEPTYSCRTWSPQRCLRRSSGRRWRFWNWYPPCCISSWNRPKKTDTIWAVCTQSFMVVPQLQFPGWLRQCNSLGRSWFNCMAKLKRPCVSQRSRGEIISLRDLKKWSSGWSLLGSHVSMSRWE